MSFLDQVTISTHKQVLANIFSHNPVKIVGAFVFTVFNYLFPNNPGVLAVYTLILIDTVTGTMAALKKEGEFSSGGFFRCLIKCLIYFLMLATGSLVDRVIPIAFAGSAIESFLAITEAISILENCGKLGIPIPTVLIRKLKVLHEKDRNDKKDENPQA